MQEVNMLREMECQRLAITVATRYLHSHTSVIHEDDYLNTVKLVTEVVKRLDRKTVEKIKFG